MPPAAGLFGIGLRAITSAISVAGEGLGSVGRFAAGTALGADPGKPAKYKKGKLKRAAIPGSSKARQAGAQFAETSSKLANTAWAVSALVDRPKSSWTHSVKVLVVGSPQTRIGQIYCLAISIAQNTLSQSLPLSNRNEVNVIFGVPGLPSTNLSISGYSNGGSRLSGLDDQYIGIDIEYSTKTVTVELSYTNAGTFSETGGWKPVLQTPPLCNPDAFPGVQWLGTVTGVFPGWPDFLRGNYATKNTQLLTQNSQNTVMFTENPYDPGIKSINGTPPIDPVPFFDGLSRSTDLVALLTATLRSPSVQIDSTQPVPNTAQYYTSQSTGQPIVAISPSYNWNQSQDFYADMLGIPNQPAGGSHTIALPMPTGG